MNKFNVFLPHLAAILFILLYFATALVWLIFSGVLTVKVFDLKRAGNSLWPNYVWRLSQQTWEKLIFGIISFFSIAFIGFYLVPWLFNSSFHISPTNDWQNRAKNADVAIVFGFGYGTEKNGRMTPEASNQFLFDLVMKQKTAKFIIIQEGVYSAAIKDTELLRNNQVALIRMHPLTKKDVKTFEASVYAINKMDSLRVKTAVVYAHNIQLKRAVSDLQKAATKQQKDFEFIVPPIPETPFPEKTDQLRTRSKVLYRALELYVSRVRDAVCY